MFFYETKLHKINIDMTTFYVTISPHQKRRNVITSTIFFEPTPSNLQKLEDIRKKYNCVCSVNHTENKVVVVYNNIDVMGGTTGGKMKEAFGYESMSANNPAQWR